jgi:hypothetical protein
LRAVDSGANAMLNNSAYMNPCCDQIILNALLDGSAAHIAADEAGTPLSPSPPTPLRDALAQEQADLQLTQEAFERRAAAAAGTAPPGGDVKQTALHAIQQQRQSSRQQFEVG